MTPSEWTASAAVVQAIAAIAAVVVTVLLLRVTKRYAETTDRMLRQMAIERDDRLASGRAPLTNLIRTTRELLLESTDLVDNARQSTEFGAVYARWDRLREDLLDENIAVRPRSDRVAVAMQELHTLTQPMHQILYQIAGGLVGGTDQTNPRALFVERSAQLAAALDAAEREVDGYIP